MEFTERSVLLLIRSRPFGTVTNFEGWRASVGMFGMDHEPTMLLLGDGVYAALKDMDDKPIRMFKSVYKSFDGRICVSKDSLEERKISPDEIQEDLEIVDNAEIGKMFTENEVVVTF